MTMLGNSAQVQSQGRYARLMGNLWRHEKTEKVGDAALGLLMRLLSFCADQGVDHVSEKRMVELFRGNANGRRQLNQLLAAGFVDAVPGGGYTPHDWSEHNRPPKVVKLRSVPTMPTREQKPARDEPARTLRGLCDDSVMNTGPENIQESTPLFKTQDPGPKTQIKEEDPAAGAAGSPASEGEGSEKRRPKLAAPTEVRQRIAELEGAYESPQLVADARHACGLSRKQGVISDHVWLVTLEKLAKHPQVASLHAMHEFATRYGDGDKGEAYLVAIARNIARRMETGGGAGLRKVGNVRAEQRAPTAEEVAAGEAFMASWDAAS